MISPIEMLALMEVAVQNGADGVLITDINGDIKKIVAIVLFDCDDHLAEPHFQFEDICGEHYLPAQVSIRSIYDKRES